MEIKDIVVNTGYGALTFGAGLYALTHTRKNLPSYFITQTVCAALPALDIPKGFQWGFHVVSLIPSPDLPFYLKDDKMPLTDTRRTVCIISFLAGLLGYVKVGVNDGKPLAGYMISNIIAFTTSGLYVVLFDKDKTNKVKRDE